eukprot:m.170599 g.170599  ORF g.170599 m.170599 type:complete len:99 (-) comp15340_c0_seq12:370-666(-)
MQAVSLQHVLYPVQLSLLGHSQLASGPRHIFGLIREITSSEGLVPFMPFNIPDPNLQLRRDILEVSIMLTNTRCYFQPGFISKVKFQGACAACGHGSV